MAKRNQEEINKRAAEAGLGAVVETTGERVEIKPKQENANTDPDNTASDTEAADR